MFLEVRHLLTLKTIAESRNLSEASESLHLTQSALSHQIKSIENYFDTPIFQRQHKPLLLTAAGRRLVELADRVLPEVAEVEYELKQIASGERGRLHITIECHACYEWLLPALDQYRESWPDIEIDIRLGMSFEPIPALSQGKVDLVITSDKVEAKDLVFEELFNYQAMLAIAPDHSLAQKEYIVADDLKEETLITYPVDRNRLDVFTKFLFPAGVEPAATRQAELTAVILQLIASGRGVAVLPDWVLQEKLASNNLITRPIGKSGMSGTLYAGVRKNDRHAAFIEGFINLARKIHA